MRTKRQPEVLELLHDFTKEYMPIIAGLSDNTIRSYKATFRLLLTFLNEVKGSAPENITFRTLDYTTITSFLDWLESEQKCSVATRNVRLASLSSFATYAQNRNSDAALIFLTNVRRIPPKKAAANPRIFFTKDEVSVLLRIPDTTTKTGHRDAVLLSLMYASGTRAQEICDLRIRNILFEAEKTTLTITGKGNKTRRVLIARSCAEMLKRYLSWRKIDQESERHVFSSQTHEHMTISCVEAIYKKHLREAKKQNPTMFQERSYTPHTMRHTCAMHMLEAGIPMMSIKNFLGHSSILTTERYAELTQSTVDKQIKGWNQRWFQDITTDIESNAKSPEKRSGIPDFLR